VTGEICVMMKLTVLHNNKELERSTQVSDELHSLDSVSDMLWTLNLKKEEGKAFNLLLVTVYGGMRNAYKTYHENFKTSPGKAVPMGEDNA
jgi:hypothetical protein